MLVLQQGVKDVACRQVDEVWGMSHHGDVERVDSTVEVGEEGDQQAV